MVATTSTIKKFPPEVVEYFPYTPRPGQALMVNEIYYAVQSKNNIAIEGAAGMGKTISCLSAILPICKREGCVLLYVARTHTQMQRVIEELAAIRNKGHALTGICLTGRANMCLNPDIQEVGPTEAMELCQLLRRKHKCDWYENLITKEVETVDGCFTAEYIREFAEESGLCPYFLGKQLIPNSDVIALTYSYLIEPFIRSILLKNLQRDIQECIIVFDECHNLPDLTMNAMSMSVSDYALKRAMKEFRHYDATGQYATAEAFLKHFAKYLEAFEKEYPHPAEETEVGVEKKAFLDYLNQFCEAHATSLPLLYQQLHQLGGHIKSQRIEAKQSSYSSIGHFATFLDHMVDTIEKPQYLHYIILSNHAQYYIRCIDCRAILKPLQKARSIVSMSGTLDPIEAYLEICGFPAYARRLVLPSPFDRRMATVFTVKGIDISFFNRTSAQYDLLAKRCLEVIRGTPTSGNSAIFCASYEVLLGLSKTTFAQGVEKLGRPLYVEQKDWSSKDNNEMITRYKADGHAGKGAVLVGVCGGRNSEGVDFPGPEMYSVVILGVPLARMTYSISTLIKYYTELFGFWKGKEYAYTLPALRKANQAAGRPIRTLHDFGAIVLLDERFAFHYYRRYLSSWLNENLVILNNQDGLLEEEIAQFYRNHQLTHSELKSKGVM